MDMNKEDHEDHEDNYFTIVPEAGMCLVGDVIVNLRNVTVIQKRNDQTLLFHSGDKDPIVLPGDVFDEVKEAAFSMDNLDFEDENFAYEDADEDDEEYDLDEDEEEDEDDEEDEDEDEDDDDEEPPVHKKRKR